MTTDLKALVAELRREADEAGPGLVIAPWIVIQAADAIEQLQRERDEAIAHDRQPYPTAAAYEAVCAALREKESALAVLNQDGTRIFESVAAGLADSTLGRENASLRADLAAAKVEREGLVQDAARWKNFMNWCAEDNRTPFPMSDFRSKAIYAVIDARAATDGAHAMDIALDKAKGATNG